MAFIIKDRVKEGTTSTGTGDISLGGASSTFDTFQSYMTNGDTTYYAIVHTSSGVDEWEVGLGTWNTGNTLTRTTVLAGSNGTSAENFSAGIKDVFMTYPADKAVYTDANGDIDINGGTIDGTTIGATAAATGKFTTLETTGNADIGGYIDLEVLSAHPAHKEGRVFYDSIHKTLNFYSDDTHVVHEIGIEEHQRVYNDTGSTILKGKPLYFSGNYTAGTIDVPTVGLADATDVNAYNAQGLAASDIPNNSYGYCIIAGQLDGFDTSGLTAGTNFFVGLTPGAVQNASPLYPNFPMCLGWVVNSDATDGTVLVNQQNHSVNSFRVRTSAHVGADLQVDGNLTVLGSTTSVSTADVTAGAPFYRANEGDAIGEGGTTFTGTGLDDAFFAGHFTGTTPTTYYVKIDGVGTGTGGVDTFAWSTDNFVTSVATGVDITGSEQLIHSADNISVTFSSTTGHTLNDQWNGTASPINVDSGFFTNYNTGTSGVGYTHTGFYYDASEGKWVLLSEYDPVPAGAIDLSDSSVSYAALKAGSFEGNLTGSVTGNVTGTATSATALATARTIGGVSFNGTANIDLPGVNTTGNQDTTGNAATATALETSRTIQLSGDVTGSASFDGSANATITAVVQDDSHSHVISNVDGLQTALNNKTPTSRTITAGNGLTGGGDLTANRTLNVGAGTGVIVTADTVAIGQAVGPTDDVTFGNVTADVFIAEGGSFTSNIDTNATSAIVIGKGYQILSDDGNYLRNIVQHTTGGEIHVGQSNTSLITGINLIPGSSGKAEVDGVEIITTAGGGLTKSNDTLSHADTSSQASVNNSGGTVIQDITLDTYGHLTGINSVNLDGRYYTESEADSRFVNATGDTLTGTLNYRMLQNQSTGNYDTAGDSSGFSVFYGTSSATNKPSGTDHAVATFSYSDAWQTQLAMDWRTNKAYLRTQENGTWKGWNQLFTDGYHPNADKWTTARTLSLSGDASGSVSWDGSANATLSVTVADDSHNHVWGNIDGASVSGLTGPRFSTPSGYIEFGPANTTWAHIYTDRPNFYFNKELYVNNMRVFNTGYHPNADKWTTARTLSLSGDASGSVSWDGSANATLSVTVANDSHSHSNYITSNADDNVAGHTEWQDNYEIRLGNGADFRMWHDGSHHYFKNFNHANGNIYFQGEDIEGTNHALLYLYTNTSRPYVNLYENGSLRLNTTDYGVNVTGRLNATTEVSTPVVDTTTVQIGSLVTLSESADRADLLQISSSTTGWGGLQIRNTSNEGRWSFMTDGESAGIYNDEDNQWHIYMTEGAGVDLRHAASTKLATTSTGISISGQIDMNNNDIVGVDQIIHEGDSNTYIQFHAADQWRVVTGGAERLEVNNSQITSTEPIHAPSFHGDGSALTGIASGANNDIFWENGQNVTSNYTITNGKNAMSAGPITINSGVTVTVGAGEVWTVV